MTADPRTPYALIVGWDGVRYDLLPEVELPTLQTVAEQGFLAGTTMPEESEAKTSTAIRWPASVRRCSDRPRGRGRSWPAVSRR